MLYVSTRNTKDTFTAHHALHEANAPDGGMYTPFRLPCFSKEECAKFRSQSCSETVTQLLNLFFGLRLNTLDVEFAIGKKPFRMEIMQHRIVVAEGWRNPEASFGYLLKSLYSLMTEKKSADRLPVGWACVAIEIALLFGMYGMLDDTMQTFDIAVTAGDFVDIAAISYAKKMGLPINMTVCTCGDNSAFWDLVNKGEYFPDSSKKTVERPDYLECCIYVRLGTQAISRYINAKNSRAGFYVSEEEPEKLSNDLYAAVVSTDRAEAIVANVFRTNGYTMDADGALAYGGLQDYRAATGAGMQTLILVKKRPVRIKE